MWWVTELVLDVVLWPLGQLLGTLFEIDDRRSTVVIVMVVLLIVLAIYIAVSYAPASQGS